MRYWLLGPTGLRVSELFLGAMTFTGPDEARKMIDLYADAGGNVIDTASAYGDSEKILGDLLRHRRDRFVLVGTRRQAHHGWRGDSNHRVAPPERGIVRHGHTVSCAPEFLLQVCPMPRCAATEYPTVPYLFNNLGYG